MPKYKLCGIKEDFIICKESDVLTATHSTMAFAREVGFSTSMQSMIATAVSELATNIIKYAGRGYITVGVLKQNNQYGIEVISEDHGPGIEDRVKALTDNFSTGNTLGVGLPGVKRLMDEMLIDSAKDHGTKIVARKWMPVNEKL